LGISHKGKYTELFLTIKEELKVMSKNITRKISLILIYCIIVAIYPINTVVAEIGTTEISEFTTIPMISAGSNHTIALKSDGTVWSWGNNEFGQLGDGTTTNRHTPVQVQNLNNVVAITSGNYYTMALRNDGTVWSWGNNEFGQLGDGTTINRYIPVQVRNLNNIMSVEAGNSHAVSLRNDGTVWTWGNNDAGQLSDGTRTHSSTPLQVHNLNDVTEITAGFNCTIVLRNDGTVWAWGRNFSGQLGDGTSISRTTPVQVQNLNNITAIAAGSGHTLALRNDGTVWAWGNNNSGQLGDNTRISRHTPVQVQGLNDVVTINAGNSHTVALRNNGSAWVWGNSPGNSIVPVQVQNLDNVIKISSGLFHIIALRSDNTVHTWGWNFSGQLGDGTIGVSDAPVQVLGENGIGYLNLGSESTNPVLNETAITLNRAVGTIDTEITMRGTIRPYPLIDFDFGDFDYYSEIVENILSSIIWSVCDETAITFGEADWLGWGWGNNFSIHIPVTLHKVGQFSVTATIPNGASRTATVDIQPLEDDALSAYFRQSSFIYNHNLATLAAELSNAVNNEFSMGSRLARLGFPSGQMAFYNYINSSNFNTVAYTIAHRDIVINGSSKNLILVAIRGTTGWREWASNLLAWPDSNEIHYGFGHAVSELDINLNTYLVAHDLLSNNKEENIVLITGYSRGGAVANLLASQLNRSQGFVMQENLHAYTFASPNVTREVTTDNDNIFNIINRNDIVTLVPRSTINIPPNIWQRHGIDLPVAITRATIEPNFGYHHDMQQYLNWMQANQGLTFEQFRTISNTDINRGFLPRLITLKCPVDITVYNSQGLLVGEIIDGIATEMQNSDVFTFVVDDAKHIFLPYGMTYTINIEATDSGILTYVVESIDALSDTPHSIKTFENVRLYTGRQMVSEIVNTPDVRLLIVEDGEIIGEIAEDGTETIFDNTEIVSVTGVSIVGATTHNLTLGQRLQLTANITPINATNRNITWLSSNTSVATVSATGEITAISAGTATITARTIDGNHTANVTLNVISQEQDNNGGNNNNNEADNNYNSEWLNNQDTIQPTVQTPPSTTTQQNNTTEITLTNREFPFIDVTQSDWYYSSVRTVWENSLMQGTANNLFSPNQSMTRAMFVQVLANLHGVSITEFSSSSFSDVSRDVWYFGAVEWAYHMGIVQGIGNREFAPNNNITREEMAVMLYRYSKVVGIEFSEDTVTEFIDNALISNWAIEAVNTMQKAGIISGRTDGNFDPPGTATRAEVATIFSRFLNLIQ